MAGAKNKIGPRSPEPADEPGVPTDWELDEHDLGLIRWTLSLTPAERLRNAQGFIRSVFRLRRARRA